MAGQYLYVTKGYNGGWSAAATDLKVSAGGGSWSSLGDSDKSAFYRTGSSTWRRFYSGIDSVSPLDVDASGFYSSGSGIASVNIFTNGTIGYSATGGESGAFYWDVCGYPDNPDIEMYATKISGTMSGVTGSSLDTWLTLNTTRGWSVSVSSGSTGLVSFSVQLRHVPTAIILATFNVSLNMEYISG
jgi:hypothetical protein